MGYKPRSKIDLHIHSTASDGTLSPAEIVTLADRLELGAIAITDHDSIEGSKEALQAGIPDSLCFLNGVEISAAPPPNTNLKGSIHILGYGFSLYDEGLNTTLELLQQARKNRNPQIIEKLRSFGMDIDYQEMLAQSSDGQIGRPHIADMMVKKGYVASIDEAFDRHLGTGKPAYVDKYRVESQKAIELINSAGGIAVLAHPGLIDIADEQLDEFVLTLKTFGLKGIEIYYPEHSPKQVSHYLAVAAKYDLILTGGTDFHGEIKPQIKLGIGDGYLDVPFKLYQTLMEKIES